MDTVKILIEDGVRTLVEKCHGDSLAAGWWGESVVDALCANPGLIPTKLMLIVSEIAEAMEGYRKGLMDDKLPHRKMIEVELADAMIRIGDLAGALGMDLSGAITEKLAFNATREDHKLEARAGKGGKKF